MLYTGWKSVTWIYLNTQEAIEEFIIMQKNKQEKYTLLQLHNLAVYCVLHNQSIQGRNKATLAHAVNIIVSNRAKALK